MSKPSLREIAKELDISPAYLSYMLNGKRPWRKDLYQRYMGVVNTFVNSEVEPARGTTVGVNTPTFGAGRKPGGGGEGIRTPDPLLAKLTGCADTSYEYHDS